LSLTGEATAKSPEREAQSQRDVERCKAEIASAEALLRAGHPDVKGLCMALSDWSTELRRLTTNSND
jgi:hypothetical protein